MRAAHIGRRLLARAATSAGGIEALAARLGLETHALRRYLQGQEALPDALFLRAVDVILEEMPEVTAGGRDGGAATRTGRSPRTPTR